MNKILIVEDEVVVARDIRQQLKLLNYDPVATTATGEESLLLAERLRPNLVLMDIHLAGDMDGIAAARTIRERFDIPVVFLTAFAGDETVLRASMAEPFGYIVKPMEERDLKITVSMAIYKHQTDKAMRMSNERFDQLARQSRTGVWEVDAHGLYTHCSEVFCELMGYPMEEIVGMKHFYDFHPDRSREDVKKGGLEIIARQSSFRDLENPIQTREGRIIWVSSTGIADLDPNGNFLGYRGWDTDITKRKCDEAVMACRMRLLQFAISHPLAELLQATLDEAELLTGSHVAFYHFLQADQVTLSLQAWSTNTTQHLCKAEGAGLHYPVNQAGVWADCIRERRPVIHNDYASLPHRKGMPEGHSAVVRELVVPVMRGDSIVALLGVGNKATDYDEGDIKMLGSLADLAWDIAEIKRSEEIIAANEAKHRIVLSTAKDGFWQVDGQGRLMEVNKAYCRMSGYSESELLSMLVTDLAVDETASAMATRIQKIKAQGEERFESMHRRKDGSIFHVEVNLQYRSADGGRLVVFLRDITERKQVEEALRVSEKRFREIAENAQDWIWETDTEGKYKYSSHVVEKIIGYTSEEILEHHFYDLFNPDERESLKSAAFAAFALKQPFRNFLNRNVHKNGQTVWLATSGIPRFDAQGNFLGYRGVDTNITESKQASDLLRKSEESLRDAQRIAHIGSWQWTLATDTVTWSEELHHISGRNPKLPPPSFAEMSSCYTAESWKKLNSSVTKALQTGESYELELDMVRLDGMTRHTSTRGEVGLDATGKIVGMHGTVQDVTERVQVDERIRHLSSAVEQSPVSIVITDLTGAIEYVNPKFTQLSGYTLAEVRGHNPCVLKGDNTSDDEYRRLWELITQGREWRGEFHNRKKNGDFYWESASISPIVDGNGRITHFLAVKLDITERKALEEQFRQAQKLESVGQLAGGVAHDFNNILAVIMIRLNFLQKNTRLDPETQEMVADMTVDAKRAANLTRQLLLFSRRSVMEVESLELNELVANLVKMLGRLIGDDITVQFNKRKVFSTVEADAVMLEQVLMNLSVNARDAMPKGGRLTIEIETVLVDEEQAKGNLNARAGQFVCLSVTDTGCGMGDATLKRIFEPFFTTKAIGKGTGLGLATVHGIVTQHKGWVDVESELGKGTTFKVFLPSSTKVINESTQAEKTAATRGYETILLVEDEAKLRQLVAKGLRLLGYRVFAADNGQTAMKLWQEHSHRIELLFSDMMMPEGMTGLDLAEKMKEEKPSLKVIISSGYNMEMAGQGSPTAGGIVYFQKPYDFEVLSQTIRDCLDRV
jgi:PAS domain S-box-containing protein